MKTQPGIDWKRPVSSGSGVKAIMLYCIEKVSSLAVCELLIA